MKVTSRITGFSLEMQRDGQIERGAVFSPTREYRYTLWRRWSHGDRWLVVIGLNPSTADETQDDPTIRRCIGFAKRERCDGLMMLNLFALRATDPAVMFSHPMPIGESNDAHIRAQAAGRNLVVAAWGVGGRHRDRDLAVAQFIPNLLCLGTTKDGHPRHPLYLPKDAALVPFTPRSR